MRFQRVLFHPGDDLGGTDDGAGGTTDHSALPAPVVDDPTLTGGGEVATGDDDFLAIPSDIPLELQPELERIQAEWKTKYNDKRTAEREELRTLQKQVADGSEAQRLYQAAQDDPQRVIRLLQANLGDPPVGETPQERVDRIAEEIARGGYDEDGARHTRSLLDITREEAVEEAMRRMREEYGGEIDRARYERTRGAINGRLGEGFLDQNENDVLAGVREISGDVEQMTEAASIRLAIRRGDVGALDRLIGPEARQGLQKKWQEAANAKDRDAAAAAGLHPAAGSPAGGSTVPLSTAPRSDEMANTFADINRMSDDQLRQIIAGTR